MSKRYLRYLAVIIISGIWLFIGCKEVEKPIENEPRIEIIESTNEFLEFRVHVPEFKFYDVKTEKGAFQRILVPNHKHHLLISGFEYISYPEVPVLTTNIALPVAGEYESIEIVAEAEPKNIKAKLYPVQRPLNDFSGGKDSIVFEFDEKKYYSKQTRIKDIISFEPIQKSDVNVYKLTINLVDYNPEESQITWYPAFICKIKFKGKLDVYKKDIKETSKYKMDQIDKYYESLPSVVVSAVLNKNLFREYVGTVEEELYSIGCRLLIITHPDFLSAAQDLRDHKRSIGISTTIITTQTISDKYGDGSGDVTDQQVKDYIKYYYNRSLVRPKWLLLIGDSEFIPTHYTTQKNFWVDVFNAGDQFYGQLDDNDYSIPVFGIGRFPVDTDGQADIIVDKIIEYENNPPFATNSYYGNLTFAALFQDENPWNPITNLPTIDHRADRRFAETAEHIRSYLLTQGYFFKKFWIERIYTAPAASNPRYWSDGSDVPTELRRPNFDWDGNTGDIINAIDNGTSILFHRDHGNWTGWGHPSFTTNNLMGLNILGNEFPVVFSVNCRSGIFDNETVNLADNIYDPANPYGTNPASVYWAERFIRNDDGAIGVIGGGMRNSGSNANNTLSMGLFDAVFPNYDATFGSSTSIRTIGDVLNHAKLHVSNSGFTASSILHENTIYNLLGDPTISVKAKPCWHLIVAEVVPYLEKEYLEIHIKHFDTKYPEHIPPDPKKIEKVRIVALSLKDKEVIGRGLEIKKGVIQLPIGKYRGELELTFSSPDIFTTKYKYVVR